MWYSCVLYLLKLVFGLPPHLPAAVVVYPAQPLHLFLRVSRGATDNNAATAPGPAANSGWCLRASVGRGRSVVGRGGRTARVGSCVLAVEVSDATGFPAFGSAPQR